MKLVQIKTFGASNSRPFYEPVWVTVLNPLGVESNSAKSRLRDNSCARILCVCVCVCVCEREREKEREREREREREKERER